jgi:toxin ParE1/3/4
MRYRVSRAAEQDLEEIFFYWAKRAGEHPAERIIDAIVGRFALLANYPEAGKLVSQISPGVRCFPAGKYLIYYRRTPRWTDIIHIFHGARDQGAAFRRER